MKKLNLILLTALAPLALLACERRETPVTLTEAIEESTQFTQESAGKAETADDDADSGSVSDSADAKTETGSEKDADTSAAKSAEAGGVSKQDSANSGSQAGKDSKAANTVSLSKKGVNPGTVKLSDLTATVEKEDKSTVYTDGNGDIVLDADLIYPVVSIPGNDAVAASINAAFDALRQEDDKWIYQCTKDPTYEIPKDAYWIYLISRDYEIKRMENGILSIMLTGSKSWRDEAPTLTATLFNFDLKTGKVLSLQDFFTDPKSVQSAVAKNISKQIEASADRPKFNDNYEEAVCIWDDHQWYLTRDSLVVVFGPYMIASSDYGIPEFSIPLKDLKDFWAKK